MKKLLLAIALLTFPTMALTGCGGSGGGTIEPAQESDGMTADQQQQYQEQMKSGGGGSARPGN